jgi:hypothetical protein
MSLFDSIFGAGSKVIDKGASLYRSTAPAAVQSKIVKALPPGVRKPASAAINGLRNNPFDDAGIKATTRSIINSTKLPPELKSLLSDLVGYEPVELMGGITAKEARDLYKKVAGVQFAKKNLFFISIKMIGSNGVFSVEAPAIADEGKTLDSMLNKQVNKATDKLKSYVGLKEAPKTKTGYDLNMFATEVQYGPITITGNAENIGSGNYDVLTNAERVEMNITTLDDKHGSIKKWFQAMADRTAHADGTFGYPSEYLMKVRVVHGFMHDTTDKDKSGKSKAPGAYVDEFIMRPGRIDYSLSRREDALQELQLSLVQFDTFNTFGAKS